MLGLAVADGERCTAYMAETGVVHLTAKVRRAAAGELDMMVRNLLYGQQWYCGRVVLSDGVRTVLDRWHRSRRGNDRLPRTWWSRIEGSRWSIRQDSPNL